jgi:uncharacterized protein (DUF1778 family)
MAVQKHTVSVRLDPQAERRLEQAARLTRQSRGAFLLHAGDERARQILLEWAVSRYRHGDASYSELAEQTGLAIEEIMRAFGQEGRNEALAQFIASCRAVAEIEDNPAFLELAQEVVATLNSAE